MSCPAPAVLEVGRGFGRLALRCRGSSSCPRWCPPLVSALGDNGSLGIPAASRSRQKVPPPLHLNQVSNVNVVRPQATSRGRRSRIGPRSAVDVRPVVPGATRIERRGPAIHLAPAVSVPLVPRPTGVVVPVPSFTPTGRSGRSPRRAFVRGPHLAPLRATFQIRASSSAPWKKARRRPAGAGHRGAQCSVPGCCRRAAADRRWSAVGAPSR